MNKVLPLIAFLIFTLSASAQNDAEVVKVDVNTVIKTEVAIKKIDPISINPEAQYINLNFKKSTDISSVKAYIKSLQLKRKATVMS